jgi:hypothetical protein
MCIVYILGYICLLHVTIVFVCELVILCWECYFKDHVKSVIRRPTLAWPLGPTIGMLLESLATKNDNGKNIIAYIVVFEPSICYYT